jgi:transposase
MATLFGMFPFLQKLFADGGYQGPEFSTALAKVRPHLNVEIVKRSDRAKGFVVLSKRWIVERTLAWLNRCRRLAKDWENRNRKALAFLHLASIRLMLSITVVIFCWRILLISESMGHHDSEIMDDRSID